MFAWKKTIALVALALASAVAGATPTLSFSAPVDVAVRIADIADLYTYQFSVIFDPRLLQVASVDIGGFLGAGGPSFGDPGLVDNGAGTLSFAFDTLLGPVGGVAGAGTLLSIHFDTLGAGSAALDLADVLFLDSTGAEIGIDTRGGTLAIADAGGPGGAVPEPATALLLGIGGLGLAARRRRAAA